MSSQGYSEGDCGVDPVKSLINELHGFERLIRRAIGASGRLTTAAAEAQSYQGLSVTAGHEIYGLIFGSQARLGEALSEISNAHRRLELLGRKIGYDVTALGELKPSFAMDESETMG